MINRSIAGINYLKTCLLWEDILSWLYTYKIYQVMVATKDPLIILSFTAQQSRIYFYMTFKILNLIF